MTDSRHKLTCHEITEWFRVRLERTVLLTYRLILPTDVRNPLEYFGFLAFVCFLVLGATGILLQVYYVPDFASSYDSVSRITNQIPYGFELRSIHYYASDLMLLLSIAHFFNLYFTGKYRPPNEILWIGGLILGVVTILEAYTGYLLIMNTRAMLAVNIGAELLRTISPSLPILLIGSSYSDMISRVYTLHLVAIPAMMMAFILMHFPRRMVMDISGLAALAGSMLLLGGIAPPELGEKFIVNMPSKIIIPEWYLTGIYALLRTGIPVFTAGVLIPLIFLLTFSMIPFLDRRGLPGTRTTQICIALGLIAMIHVCLVTVWGFRAGNLGPITWEGDLIIAPELFYGSLLGIAVAIFAVLTLFYRSTKKSTPNASTANDRRIRQIVVPQNAALAGLSCILIFQILLLIRTIVAQTQGLKGQTMMNIGLVMVGFAVSWLIYRMMPKEQ